ncbi:MAG: Holliday junction branch migration protein RuvA [Patescibacteria group bacterium]
MISHLRGTVQKLGVGEVIMDVQGVGYRVSVPLDAWEKLQDFTPGSLWISSYIREDRFDLYGFLDRAGLLLFEELLKVSGIGPRLGLELCAVPKALLQRAVQEQDGGMLKSVKGVGKKTAQKVLLELKSLLEKNPLLLGQASAEELPHEFDQDAIAALTSLGYDAPAATRVLRDLPPDLRTTEERVAAALRAL